MNKKVVTFPLLVFMTVAAAPVFAAGAGEETATGDEPIVIRLGHGGSTATDLRQVAAQRFKEHVERETGPAVVVEIFPDSTLGDWREMQEGLQIGTIEIVIEDIGTLERYSDMAALGFMPFVYTGRDHWERVWYSDIKDILLTTFEQETGFKLLGSMYRGAHNFQLWGETFNGWPEEVQNAVVVAANEASRLYNSLLDESEAEIIAQLEARDEVTLIYPSAEEKRR